MDRLARIALIAVIVSGCFYSIWLLSWTEKGVLINGDAGLKFLLTRQLSQNHFDYSLSLPYDSWTQPLIAGRYFPFDEPFAYAVDDQRFIAFPILFSTLTLPFYYVFGYWGIYIIPMIALWTIWALFCFILHKLNCSTPIILGGLTTLIYASPLTVYGACFWEHTLAVLFVFGVSAILLIDGSIKVKNPLLLFVAGLLLGLSGWLRPECYIIALILLITQFDRTVSVQRVIPFAGFLTALVLHTISNQAIYGTIFGVHSFQVTKHFHFLHRFKGGWDIFGNLTREGIMTFPIAILALALPIALKLSRVKIPSLSRKILWIVVSFVVLTPYFLPNSGGYQWGPRYYLSVIPLLILSGTLLLKDLKTNSSQFANAVIVFACFLVLAGAYVNVTRGSRFIKSHYAENALLYQTVKGMDEHVIVSANPWIPMVLTPLIGEKTVLCSRTPRDMILLAHKLNTLNINRFSYIKADYEIPPENLDLQMGNRKLSVQFIETHKLAGDQVYSARILTEKIQ